MKTLIAALALTIAASAPALAGEGFGAHEQRAIAQANSYEVATFGFTGVASGEFRTANSQPSEAGLPYALQEGHAGGNTFGFTGIASGEFRTANSQPSEAGLPYALQVR